MSSQNLKSTARSWEDEWVKRRFWTKISSCGDWFVCGNQYRWCMRAPPTERMKKANHRKVAEKMNRLNKEEFERESQSEIPLKKWFVCGNHKYRWRECCRRTGWKPRQRVSQCKRSKLLQKYIIWNQGRFSRWENRRSNNRRGIPRQSGGWQFCWGNCSYWRKRPSRWMLLLQTVLVRIIMKFKLRKNLVKHEEDKSEGALNKGEDSFGEDGFPQC